jgi:hypothetical protein
VGIERQTDHNGTVKGHCPKCGPDRNAEVKGEYVSGFEDDGFWATHKRRILVCLGCEAAYFQIETTTSEDVEWQVDDSGISVPSFKPHFRHFPSPIKREQPQWAQNFEAEKLLAELGVSQTGDLWRLFDDVYDCLNADLRIPAAIAIRTTFDKATEFVGIDPSLSFAKKLDALLDRGRISEDEREILEILVDAGSAAAHRGWRPTADELETLTTLIESFLHRTFVILEAARKLKDGIPQRPKRPPKPEKQVE